MKSRLQPKILIVDDNLENLLLFRDTLAPMGYELSMAETGEAALDRIPIIKPDLILLDIVLPGIDGFEVCRRVKGNQATKSIPIIFLSARHEVETKLKGFELGAEDYISKPFHHLEVVARVKSQLQKASLFNALHTLLEHSFHELYTPLSVIDTSVEMQEFEHGNTEYTAAIRAASRTLHNIYNDLYFTFGHSHDELIKRTIELGAFLRQRISYFSVIANNRKIRLQDHLCQEELLVVISEMELERVLDNLLSNAIKYTPEGAEVVIETRKHDDGPELVISNPGKPVKNLQKIFSRYYQEDAEKQGMGIGLDIVAQICAKTGITIRAETKPDRTTFTLIFGYRP